MIRIAEALTEEYRQVLAAAATSIRPHGFRLVAEQPWLAPPGREIEGMPVVSIEDLVAGKELALNSRGIPRIWWTCFFWPGK